MTTQMRATVMSRSSSRAQAPANPVIGPKARRTMLAAPLASGMAAVASA